MTKGEVAEGKQPPTAAKMPSLGLVKQGHSQSLACAGGSQPQIRHSAVAGVTGELGIFRQHTTRDFRFRHAPALA